MRSGCSSRKGATHSACGAWPPGSGAATKRQAGPCPGRPNAPCAPISPPSAFVACEKPSPRLADEAVREGHGAFDLLMAAGRAYIRTAVRSPVLFALMRDAEAVDFAEPRLQAESGAAFRELLAIVVELQASGFEADRGAEDLSHVIWDSVHRLTMRWADAALDGPVDPATVDEAISMELTLLLIDGEPPLQMEENAEEQAEKMERAS